MAIFDEKDLEEMLNEIISELSKKSGKKKIVCIDASSDTTVPAGSHETITIQPPSGKIWKIIDVRATILSPPGATTGNHSLEFLVDSMEYTVYTRHTYSNPLYIIGASPHDSADGIFPQTKDTWQRALKSLKFSNNHYLRYRYYNNTDADQTNQRVVKLLIEEEDEAQ